MAPPFDGHLRHPLQDLGISAAAIGGPFASIQLTIESKTS